jgi:L-histidine N-alpha-methyltransferase
MSAVLHTGLRAPAPRLEAPLVDAHSAFAHDVLEGLGRPRKSIPSAWLYDLRGSQLFEQITTLDEYYPARNEHALLQRALPHVAKACGRAALVLELGSGSSRKTEPLLAALDTPAAYVPLDISAEFLAQSVQGLRARFPCLPIHPVVADFTDTASLRDGVAGVAALHAGQRLVFFPGSTIGNLLPRDAMVLLEQLGRSTGRGTLLLVGADATQDPALLLPAYDDREGVTAAFNKNLLARINRELDGDFESSDFEHQARWNAPEHRIEMHLVARRALSVQVLGRRFAFDAGESIHTEHCHKHTLLTFRALARHAGWAHRDFWMDHVSCYALHLLEFVD